MFPGFLTMICLYFLLKQMGLTMGGAVPGLILISVASSGMGYYVCKGYFDTIPKSLDEAAIIDGATRAQILWKMIIPLSKPIIIYTSLEQWLTGRSRMTHIPCACASASSARISSSVPYSGSMSK